MHMAALPRCTPAEVDVDPGGLYGFLHGCAHAGVELHSLMLLRHGHVFAEGWWAPYSRETSSLVYSLSKTFVSAAVGLAVADGVLSYDDTLVALFADVLEPGAAGPKASRITVRHCLTMTTGHTEDVVPALNLAASPGRTPWAHVLAVEPPGVPGETFCYNQWATWTLAEVVAHATGRDVFALLSERLFAPLGLAGASWDRDVEGRVLGYSGLRVPTETLASFFQLLLDGGVRDGVRLLPTEWVEQHARAHVLPIDARLRPDWSAGYGWQFWRNARGGYRGDGAFGQFGIVLPEHDLVVVLTGETSRMDAVLDQVWGHLVPALGRPATADQDAVAATLAGLHLAPIWGDRGARVHLTFENRKNRWRLTDDADGWTLRWVDSRGGDNLIGVGHGTWRHTTLCWPGRELRVAASGAWRGWGQFEMRLIALDTPHSMVIRLTDDGSGRAEWVHEPGWVKQFAGLAVATR